MRPTFKKIAALLALAALPRLAMLPALATLSIFATLTLSTTTFFIAVPVARAADMECKEEAEKLCPGKEWGEGLDDCLKEHRRALSTECRRHVEEIKVKSVEKDPEAHKRSGASCKDDGNQFCRGMRGSKMWKCLKSHREELGEDCKGLVDKRFRR